MKSIAVLILLAVAPLAWAQHNPSMHHMDQGQPMPQPNMAQPNMSQPSKPQPMPMPSPGAAGGGLPPDTRELVKFPAPLRDHTLASMRDHLFTLQRIQEALATDKYDVAAKLAEERLGLSSFGLHQAHEVAKYMPKGMAEAGTAMHRAASRFAVAAQTAGATGDIKPAVEALSQVTMACVSCHAGYRLH